MTATLFEAPAQWQCATLAELCSAEGGDIQTGPFGSQLHASDYVEHGIPSVMPQNIGDNVIHPEGIARITSEDARRLSRYLLTEGDIVYSRRGDVERRALVRANQEGWLCGTGCLRIRPGAAVDSRYLSYYLGHPEVRRWIVRHAVGATMLNLNSKILGEVPVLVPPRVIQKSVAALLGAIDDKIAVNDRIAETTHMLAAAEHARVAQQAERACTLGDVIELSYGKALPAAQRRPGPVAVYGSGGPSGWHDQSLVRGPGIIVGRKGTVGSVYWSHRDFFPIDTTYYISVTDDRLTTEYVYFLLTRLGLSEMNSDSAVPGLNRSRALAIPVHLPNGETIAEFTERVRPLFAVREQMARENQALTQLRDTLLPGLMSGQLRIKDAEHVVEVAV
ncbi:restriction endonuclease subunit S [Micromonospora sp. NBC_01405]|uniref:restriction endonuclease subunit S n=1 Tax=Micromonospora sp. NBC_01405 TaxID=2903589 RepID=UPI003253CC08